MKRVSIEYLYLDLETCERCVGTDQILEEVIEIISPALLVSGYEIDYKKVEMSDEKIAKEYLFLSSPTIRVNGKDICQSVAENSCGCCSDISGTDVDCRVFIYNGESYEVPPKEMIATSILQNVFSKEQEECCGCGEYELPENLKSFYEGKKSKQ